MPKNVGRGRFIAWVGNKIGGDIQIFLQERDTIFGNFFVLVRPVIVLSGNSVCLDPHHFIMADRTGVFKRMFPYARKRKYQKNRNGNSVVNLLTRATIQIHAPPSSTPQLVRSQRPKGKSFEDVGSTTLCMNVLCFPDK